MALNMRELAKLAKFARKNGITSIKVDGIEMQIHAAFLDQVETKEEPVAEETNPQSIYSDEDALFWSSTSHGGN
jgi:hypothetical protein